MDANVIPTTAAEFESIDPRLVALIDPMGPAAEQFRMLHHRLDRVRSTRTLGVVAFTSALAGEGKSTTAANLAACAAKRGRKAVLVDCDLRRPGTSKLFGFEAVPPGLAGVLDGEVTVRQAIRRGPEGLAVVPAGRTAEDPSGLFATAHFRGAIDELRGSFDEIYLDLPPILAFADAHVAASVAEGVVMVVRSGQTRVEVVQEAVDAFTGLPLLGCVLTGCDEALPMYRTYYKRK